ncbi:MAG: ABC transporter ATP-binding protein [Alphaproteobacteria bacterium]|nr:ABC transporter ATP-binding protein [Alphaproteobacteria bacterium]MBP7729783.1 ABC transporter ATP-binding protein [Alphaproteobacteria bacterium]
MDLEPWQDVKAKPYIHLEGVSKDFNGSPAVDDVTLSIFQGEFFSLLGPSGCGKTTLLRMLAGFEMPSKGKIYIDGVDMTRRPAYDRPVNMMFQSYALFPHMTVEQNISFGLKQERLAKAEIRERGKDVLKLVQMEKYEKRYPHQLSGGQRQRVALARSLVKRPKLLLLDEPLAALDKRLREQTQFELVRIQEKVGITFIMVTHDQEEAMTMSSRLGVMDHGRLRQIGTPNEVYEYPHSEYVADFIGSMNKFEGRVIEDETDHVLVESEEASCELYVSHAGDAPLGSQVKVAIRPEKIMITTIEPEQKRNTTKGIVKDIGYLGDVSIYHVELSSGKIVLATQPNIVRLAERPVTWDDEVYLFWRAENSIVLTT